MTKPAEDFRAAVLAVGLFATPALALAQLNESPIKTGFWSFPSDKTGAAKDILAACRDHFEVRFADGHFIGVRLRKTAMYCGPVLRHSAGLIQAASLKATHERFPIAF
jgi:hypothetical protein